MTCPEDNHIVKALFAYYNDESPNNLKGLENELSTYEYSERFGYYNSGGLEMFVIHFDSSKLESVTTWIKQVRGKMIDMGIMALPEWMNDKQSVVDLQTKILGLVKPE
jgi:hypothetical protein